MSGRRRKRRLRCCAPEFANVHKTPDCMEVLATQYNEKCKVESSTESESDACTTEAPMNANLADSLKNHEAVKQYLDPYDGDLESTSSESESNGGFLVDAYTEKIHDQPHSLGAIDGKKLPIKPLKKSFQTTFEPVCSYKELIPTQMEPVPTADVLLQSSSESEVLSISVPDLPFPTNRLVLNTKQKQLGSLDLGMLTDSPAINATDIGGKIGLVSMLALQSPGKYYPRQQNVNLCSGRKISHERSIEGKFTPKRKLGNSLTDIGNDQTSKKKSHVI
ncbi:uncharacterized protein LOC119952984 [Scyliorhinus canicula]|uniref:uncharacterized protein LOC119952984 n=1 Tax=Scyliorhinus canicula TaxID=7830 RepID=UPI0018F4C4FE|nr:uncharacterized protein LOC119952984 [Scyliorhinus canicula]